MSFSQSAGTAIIPFLGRLVLCVAFVSAGYNKLFKDASFDSEQATILRDHYGVEVVPDRAMDDPAAEMGIDPSAAGEFTIRPVSLQEDQAGQDAGGEEDLGSGPGDEADPGDAPPAEIPAEIESESADAAETETPATEPEPVEPASAGTQIALYHVTLMLHDAGLPYGKWAAWVAALTEFIGGILLLVGFFSRIWGLGLAIAMGVAFYLTTMQGNPAIDAPPVFTVLPWAFAENTVAFNTMFSQLGLGLLALGIFLTGPGPVSLDRLFFGGRGGRKDAAAYD